MTVLKKTILIMAAILVSLTVEAKIPSWVIAPGYEQLTRYSGDFYAYKDNGKWGLMRRGDKVAIPARYDFITPFTNGYSLAGNYEEGNYRLAGIINEQGNMVALSRPYYLPRSSQYVSEGKLAVADKSGKYGYINPAGAVVVKFQFDNALPFKEGWAPVKKGNYSLFINENYDNNPSKGTMVVDFHYGEMTAAGCFSGGTAPIAYNKDYALVDSHGRKVKKLSENEFSEIYKANSTTPLVYAGFSESGLPSTFTENGKQGLTEGGVMVVPAQFDSFNTCFNDGDMIVTFRGRQGVLRLIDGHVTLTARAEGSNPAEIEVDRNDNPERIRVECELPTAIADFRIIVIENNGAPVDMTSSFKREGNTAVGTIVPRINNGNDRYSLGIDVESDGFPLASEKRIFSVAYPVRLNISAPGPKNSRANEWGEASVSSTITNDSAKEISVSGSWSNGKNFTVTVPARSSRTVSTTFKVQDAYSSKVTITVTGEKPVSSTINFIPYF